MQVNIANVIDDRSGDFGACSDANVGNPPWHLHHKTNEGDFSTRRTIPAAKKADLTSSLAGMTRQSIF
jgi:hypothetical protein